MIEMHKFPEMLVVYIDGNIFCYTSNDIPALLRAVQAVTLDKWNGMSYIHSTEGDDDD